MATVGSVIFVTSVYDEVREGPAIYANYLFEYFRKHPAINFFLVTLGDRGSDPDSGIYRVPAKQSSYATYKALQKRALHLAEEIDGPVIFHGNSAHTMWKILGAEHRVFVQINDYDNATVTSNIRWYLDQKLYRRLLVMLWRRYNEWRAVKRADLVICNSEYTKQIVRSSYRFSASSSRVIYKAVDTAKFDKGLVEDLRYKGNCSPIRLIFVGTNWQRKGLYDLLVAFNEVVKVKPNLILDVYGPSREELSKELLGFIEAHDIQSKVNIHGRIDREQLPVELHKANLAILPSHFEALGVSIIEALAAGVPVIATNVGGIPEILQGYECGVLVEPKNPDAIKREILRLLNSDSLLKSMSSAAVRRASDFGKERMLKSVEAAYIEFLQV